MFQLIACNSLFDEVVLRGRHPVIDSVIEQRLLHSRQRPRCPPVGPYWIRVEYDLGSSRRSNSITINEVEVSFEDQPGQWSCFFRLYELEGKMKITSHGGLKNFYLEMGDSVMSDLRSFIGHLEKGRLLTRLARQGPNAIPTEDEEGDGLEVLLHDLPSHEERDLAKENLENTAHD